MIKPSEELAHKAKACICVVTYKNGWFHTGFHTYVAYDIVVKDGMLAECQFNDVVSWGENTIEDARENMPKTYNFEQVAFEAPAK